MDRESLTILKAELESQMGEAGKIYNKIEERRLEKGKSALESIAYQLHNLYCAFEDLFKIVADAFENHIHHKGISPGAFKANVDTYCRCKAASAVSGKLYAVG